MLGKVFGSRVRSAGLAMFVFALTIERPWEAGCLDDSRYRESWGKSGTEFHPAA